jgi:hypothetical protein
MFAEIYEWLTTPCPREARKLGYLREAIAIRARYKRHRTRWQPHLDASKATIRTAIKQPGDKRVAVVLGSGALYDVPLDALAAAFERVELIDIVHPKEARQIAAAYPNVTLRSEDISGTSQALAAMPRRATQAPGVGAMPQLAPETDLVVSVNLLSQLAEIPLAWLQARTNIAEGDRLAFAAEIVRCHVQWLSVLKCRVCVISDIERHYVDQNGTPLEPWDSLHGVSLPEGGTEWSWDLAPAGETHPKLAIQTTVRGLSDFNFDAPEEAAK